MREESLTEEYFQREGVTETNDAEYFQAFREAGYFQANSY